MNDRMRVIRSRMFGCMTVGDRHWALSAEERYDHGQDVQAGHSHT